MARVQADEAEPVIPTEVKSMFIIESLHIILISSKNNGAHPVCINRTLAPVIPLSFKYSVIPQKALPV